MKNKKVTWKDLNIIEKIIAIILGILPVWLPLVGCIICGLLGG